MPEPTIIQVVNNAGGLFVASGVASDAEVMTSNVTAGSAIVVTMASWSSGIRTYACSDDVDGSYTKVTQLAVSSNRQNALFYILGHTGGATTVTTSVTSSTSNWAWQAIEIGDADEFDVSDSQLVASNTKTHDSSAAGINTAVNVAVFISGNHNANAGSLSATGYTLISYTQEVISAYKTSASAITGEKGTWASTTSRNHAGIVLSLKSVAAAASDPFFAHRIDRISKGQGPVDAAMLGGVMVE